MKSVELGTSLHGDGYVIQNIDICLRALDRFQLKVTKRASWRIQDINARFKKLPKDTELSEEDCDKLQKELEGVKVTLMAETQGHIAYVATDKRHSAEKLGDEIWTLFADGAKTCLPSVAAFDIEEAGKCILFERSTAAAFHLMRSVEASLKAYHALQGCTSKGPATWGSMLSDLRAKDAKKNPELLDHLDSIRRNFRNPTQHPEKIYDIQEVQDLLGICIDVTNRICRELKTSNAP